MILPLDRTRRFADPLTLAGHPLATDGSLPAIRVEGNIAHVRLQLQGLPAGSIIIPSFASLVPNAYRFVFRLNQLALLSIPSTQKDAALSNRDSHLGIEQQLDYFVLREPQDTLTLDFAVEPANALDDRYLLTISARPLTLATASDTGQSAWLEQPLAPLSQRLAPAAYAPHCCSPTSVAMVLGYLGRSVPWVPFIEQCRDRASKLFGLWPHNIYQASRVGVLGAVEANSDWRQPLALLRADLPVVASIRYPQGALPGAPQPASAGHLVVLAGVDAHSVLVNDPAGETLAAVSRRYAPAAFAKAWFEHRGAAYYFLR